MRQLSTIHRFISQKKTVEPSTLASINYFRVTTTWNEVSSSIKYPPTIKNWNDINMNQSIFSEQNQLLYQILPATSHKSWLPRPKVFEFLSPWSLRVQVCQCSLAAFGAPAEPVASSTCSAMERSKEVKKKSPILTNRSIDISEMIVFVFGSLNSEK